MIQVFTLQMKNSLSHTTRIKQSVGNRKYDLRHGSIEIKLQDVTNLFVSIPIEEKLLKSVTLNGEKFYREDEQHYVVRIAPVKYTDENFKEVNELQKNKSYTVQAALEELAEKNNFNFDGFKRQYYQRGWNKTKKIKEL